MAPTKRNIKHKPEKTEVGEKILDLVISYIHNGEDRNSVSLVSRKFYEIDGLTRKRVTVHTLYSNPSRLSKRFPFIESLTLIGPPSFFDILDDYDFGITPWIEQLALEFRSLKELHIRGLVVHDEDLETFMRTHGNDLRNLRISKCKGFSADGLIHISKYCNQLRTLCLKDSNYIKVKDGIWLHQLALNSTVLERLHVTKMDIIVPHNLTLLAKNCCNSLLSLKIGKCYPSKLGDAFKYAVRLEHFGGYIWDEENELVDFQLPPNMPSLSIYNFVVPGYSIGRPFMDHIRKLKLVYLPRDEESRCLFFKMCPNLEVLYTNNQYGDRVLQVIGEFCKKLRKFTHYGPVTHKGLIALAKGCTKIECLNVELGEISDEAIKCLGTHLKNLRKFSMQLVKKNGTTDISLDNGVRAMLISCRKLEWLDMSLENWDGGLTDVGLEYIGKYGRNLRFLSLTRIGKSDAGLVNLSKGCPNLRELKLSHCPFSKEVVTSFVFNMPSLRYVWFCNVCLDNTDGSLLALSRPEF